MAKRVARKIKRAGKTACQFKFTSTFEYIDLECKGGWRPNNLKVIWLRSHRRAQSINVEWVCMDDRGPNGASGRAVFDPPISASLIVTLYKDSKKPYEEKEYKYYIENEGPGGKKILASFTCDMAEYAGIPSSRHALEMNFKPISSKIKKCYLGITLESEFVKEGNANDDDMQSTFSAVEPGAEEMVFADEVEDEEDDDDLDEAATLGKKIITNMTSNESNEPEHNTTEPSPPTDQDTTTTTTATTTTTTTDDNDQKTECTSTTTTTTSDTPSNPPAITVSGQDSAAVNVLPWLQEIELVDHTDTPVDLERLSSADVIAFYFSASWCPPCKTFLPNLKKFYSALKDNEKSFEMIYVSSDYSREEMVAYMSETSMPWIAIRYGHKLTDKLRQDYTVRVIPILVVVSRDGKLLEENAKKQVDKAASASSSTAACIQLYNNWVEKITNPFASTTTEDDQPVKQKTGIMSSIRKALTKEESSEKKATVLSKSISTDEPREAAESKTPKSKINSGGNKEELIRQLEDKENVIRQLEEVNMSLKHTNDDLNNEVRNLKARVELLNDELKSMRQTDAQKKEDDEMFREYLKLQGWLFKRGIKGPTANKWRRRYFRLDQGTKLYYYKNHTEGTPQGFIDLLKVISVMELNAAQQDKNNASFNIESEGRTYQLQAYDEAEMRRWITAISKLKEFYRKQQSEAAAE